MYASALLCHPSLFARNTPSRGRTRAVAEPVDPAPAVDRARVPRGHHSAESATSIRGAYVTLHRRFHIGDVLSLVTGQVVAPRGARGVRALCAYMAARPYGTGSDDPLAPDPYGDTIPEAYRRYLRDFRTALLSEYPDLSAYEADDVPTSEFQMLWVQRRAAEFGQYLVVPRLAPDHPLRAAAEPVGVEAADTAAAAEQSAALEHLIENSATHRRDAVARAAPNPAGAPLPGGTYGVSNGTAAVEGVPDGRGRL